jgi:hypothetical protein
MIAYLSIKKYSEELKRRKEKMNGKTGQDCISGSCTVNGVRLESNFLRISSSILYSLSALSILWGLSEIIEPVFHNPGRLTEKILCISYLHFYELAIFGLILMLILWKKVKNDAMTLMIISAFFYIAGGVLIDTVTPASYITAGAIGLFFTLIASAKIFVLRSYCRIPFKALLFYGLNLIFIWNYLTTSLLSKVHQSGKASITDYWYESLILMLTGIFLILLQSAKENRTETEKGESGNENSGAVWIFTMALTITALFHQYIITYIYDLEASTADYLPALTLISFILIELIDRFKIKIKQLDLLMAYTPLILMIIIKNSVSFINIHGITAYFWNPGTISLFAGAWAVSLAFRKNNIEFLYPAGIYFSLFILYGMNFYSTEINNANWVLLGASIICIMIFSGILFRNITLLYSGTLTGIIGIMMNHSVEYFLSSHSVPVVPAGMIFTAMTVLYLYIFTKNSISEKIIYPALILNALGVFFTNTHSLPIWFIATVTILALTAGAVYFSVLKKRKAAFLISSPLLLYTASMLKSLNGWHYIALSFLLLGVGFCLSLKKVQKQKS